MSEPAEVLTKYISFHFATSRLPIIIYDLSYLVIYSDVRRVLNISFLHNAYLRCSWSFSLRKNSWIGPAPIRIIVTLLWYQFSSFNSWIPHLSRISKQELSILEDKSSSPTERFALSILQCLRLSARLNRNTHHELLLLSASCFSWVASEWHYFQTDKLVLAPVRSSWLCSCSKSFLAKRVFFQKPPFSDNPRRFPLYGTETNKIAFQNEIFVTGAHVQIMRHSWPIWDQEIGKNIIFNMNDGYRKWNQSGCLQHDGKCSKYP